MADKLDDLKAMIDTLDENSSLRKALEKVVYAEQTHRTDDETAPAAEAPEQEFAEEENKADDTPEAVDASSNVEPSDFLEDLKDNFGKLLDDDTFISTSAGFLLGAAVVGLGALTFSSLKK